MSPMPPPPSRFALIDAFKAVASQLIVLHHLAFYGPMSDIAQQLAPALMNWLSRDARIAVQVFLVIGGFLAARSLAPQGVLQPPRLLPVLRSRYLKLVLPYAAALLVGIACAALARAFMVHPATPQPPGLWQVLVHLLLLHDVLDVEALSAGVWYVAIDFQLFVLLALLLWLARRWGGGEAALVSALLLGGLLVAALAALSLFHFNRYPDWDEWALYFAGAYGLGVLAYWLSDRARWAGWLWLLAAGVLLALVLEFRSRIAVALLVALALGWGRRSGALQNWPPGGWWAYFGKISYAVFLLNFPVALVVNALFTRFVPAEPWPQMAGVLLAWLLCNVAGALFYRWVELPASRWRV
ncbi:MAG: acyltransferase family protein [Pseudomonadota bacterium]